MKKKINITEYYNDLCLSYGRKYGKPEEWKPVTIDNVATKYMVSNYGRVIDPLKGKHLPVTIYRGHYRVGLSIPNKGTKVIGTYRLVGLMFIPVPQKYFDMGYKVDELVVDHRREDDTDNFNDNTVWNLQWLTHRENISKSRDCGFREAYAHDFREKLDTMILKGCGNAEIFKMCKDEYGYDKDVIKAMVQVRRRRLGVILKEHYEEPKELTAKMDELIKQGLTNDEIVKKLNLPDDGRRSRRILQYRRSLLGIKNQTSKFLSNEQNEKLRKLIISGMKTPNIISSLDLTTLSPEQMKKLKDTIASRRIIYFKKGQMTKEAYDAGKSRKRT